MIPYTLLTDYEVSCIYDYLQTVPPISNNIQRTFYDYICDKIKATQQNVRWLLN